MHARAAQNKFLILMARRNHLGRIVLNRNTREMSVRVTVNGREQIGAKEVQDLKQLSGGGLPTVGSTI